MSGGLVDFQARLNGLFDRVPDPKTGKPYTNAAVARELSQAGTPVSGGYLGQLRLGHHTDPSANLVGALAEFFGVPANYFFGSGDVADDIEAQLDRLSRARTMGMQGLMARSEGVSQEGLDHLAAILDHIRKLEGLD